ncbi:hypothetical protein RQP46_011104 [Phenoliferia psychrophenolica]
MGATHQPPYTPSQRYHLEQSNKFVQAYLVAGLLSTLLLAVAFNIFWRTAERNIDYMAHHAARLAFTNLPLDQSLNVFHRWIARLILLLSTFHVIGRLYVNVPNSSPHGDGQAFVRWGIVGYALFFLMILGAARPIRNRWYQAFIITHVAAFILGLVALSIHRPEVAPWLYAGFIIYFLDRIVRTWRIVLHHGVRKIKPAGTNGEVGSVEVMSPSMIRVKVQTTLSWVPGQHIYLHVPFLSAGGHPFSVCSIDTPTSHPTSKKPPQSRVVLLVRVREGLTRRLYALAMRDLERGGRFPTAALSPCWAEGPYGKSSHLDYYQTVLLIAGGSGVSFTNSVMLDIVRRARGMALGYRDVSVATVRLTFVWVVKLREDVTWISEALEEAAQLAPAGLLRILIFVTSESASQTLEQYDRKSLVDNSSATPTQIQYFSGRPNIPELLETEIMATDFSNYCAVGTCGPSALTTDVADAITELGMRPKCTIELVKWQERPVRAPGALPKIRGSPYPNRVASLFQPKPPRYIPRLPNEIIHLIIESLDGKCDLASLATLCRVSKDLLSLARNTLYANINLVSTSREPKESSQLLLDSLVLHPHLAARVRQIRVYVDDDEPSQSPLSPAQAPFVSYLRALLPTCSAVERLDVELSFVNDDSPAKDILGALASLAPSLKYLSVDVYSQETVDVEVSALLRLAKGLKSLTFHGKRTWVGEPPTFELEELKVSDTCPQETFHTLTQSSTSTIQTLLVFSNFGRWGESQKPDVALFPNLRTLRMTAYHDQDQEHLDKLCLGISNLPLRHLALRACSVQTFRLRYFHFPPNLPATLTSLSLDIPTIGNITLFLDSGMCPLLSSASFQLQSKPNPWTRVTLARAGKEHGLRVMREEPMWDGDYKEKEKISYGPIGVESQMRLEDYWG